MPNYVCLTLMPRRRTVHASRVTVWAPEVPPEPQPHVCMCLHGTCVWCACVHVVNDVTVYTCRDINLQKQACCYTIVADSCTCVKWLLVAFHMLSCDEYTCIRIIVITCSNK